MLWSLARIAKDIAADQIASGSMSADVHDLNDQLKQLEAAFGTVDNHEYFWS
jgi:hypothetical protein